MKGQKDPILDQRFIQYFTQKWKNSVFTLGPRRQENRLPIKIIWNFSSESQRDEALSYLKNLMKGSDEKLSSIKSYDEEKNEVGATLMVLTPRITISNTILIERLYQEANQLFIEKQSSVSLGIYYKHG